MTRYDVTPLRWFLSQLRADSMMVFWSSRRHQEVTTSKEPFYGARYIAGERERAREGWALYSTRQRCIPGSQCQPHEAAAAIETAVGASANNIIIGKCLCMCMCVHVVLL